MPEIAAQDYLHWHSGRASQDHAVRLCAFCSAIFPTDQNLARLVEEQIISEVMGLAFHGRRTMERAKRKDATIASYSFWPSSSVVLPNGLNLWDAFGRIIHAESIAVCWERLDDEATLYKGREAKFPGHIEVTSNKGAIKVPTGRLAASYIGLVLNLHDSHPH